MAGWWGSGCGDPEILHVVDRSVAVCRCSSGYVCVGVLLGSGALGDCPSDPSLVSQAGGVGPGGVLPPILMPSN